MRRPQATRLRKLYILSGKVLYYLLVPLLIIYGRSSRKPRVRVFLTHDNKILLVKNWLSPQLWTLPGGGISLNETEEQALKREIKEELGISLPPRHLNHIGAFLVKHPPAPFRVSVYSLELRSSEIIITQNKKEIIDAQWHPLSSLPRDISPEFNEAHALYSINTIVTSTHD